jgi:hypothetical protein
MQIGDRSQQQHDRRAMSYVEFPTDVIIDVHFKKKSGGPPTGPCPDGAPYAGSYTYGAHVAQVGYVITYTPDNAVEPFVGSFKSGEVYGPSGHYGALSTTPDPDVVITAGIYGLAAAAMTLNPTSLMFTNAQIMQLVAQGEHSPGGVNWVVPMVTGSERFPDGSCIPHVIDHYHVELSWSDAAPYSDLWGFGIVHPMTHGGPIVAPPVPNGPIGNGFLALDYDFQWKNWVLNEWGEINEGNQYDASIGGPAVIMLMVGNATSGRWTSWGWFGATGQVPGDKYQWTVSATTILEPSLFG